MGMLKFAWLLLSGAVLAVTLALYNPTTGSDADLILVYGMLVLAFPSAFLVAGMIAFASYAIDTLHLQSLSGLSYGRLSITLTWIVMVIVGYVQWFLVLPAFFSKLRARRRQASARDGPSG